MILIFDIRGSLSSVPVSGLQLAGSSCSGGLMAAPLRAPLVALLELERQCCKWCAELRISIQSTLQWRDNRRPCALPCWPSWS